MYRVRLALVLFLLAAASVALAGDPETAKIAGSYTARGEDINGQKYTATVEIEEEGEAYRVTWHYRDGAEFIGIGIRTGKQLSVSWAGQLGNKVMVGVMVYEVKKNGSMEGKWTILGAKGRVRAETLAPSL